MARSRPDGELARIAEIVRGGGGRSRLYRWLKARHDAFAALLAEDRPDWRALADGFAAMGLTGQGGSALGPEACRHTWWRCRRDVAKARAATRRRAPTPTTVVAVPPAHRPSTDGAGAGDAGAGPPAGARVSTGGDALARLRAEMDRRSGRG